MKDLGLTGLYNDANITDPGQYGGADVLTTSLDIYVCVRDYAIELIKAKYDPPFLLQMTPGVLVQSIVNKEAGVGGRTDLELIMALKLPDGTPFFDIFLMNPFLVALDQETSTTGAICAMAKSSPNGRVNFEVVESYPLGFYPLPAVDLGITGKYLWMGAVEIPHPDSIVYRGGYTTTTFD